MLNRSNRGLDATPVARINCSRQLAPASLTLACQEFVAMAAVLDRHMEGRQFIVNDSIAAADCITAYTLDWGNQRRLIDCRDFEPAQHP
jgi:hypothetical protein